MEILIIYDDIDKTDKEYKLEDNIGSEVIEVIRDFLDLKHPNISATTVISKLPISIGKAYLKAKLI